MSATEDIGKKRRPTGMSQREAAGWMLRNRTKLDKYGCLIWTGAKNYKGYGQINFKGRSHPAHRFIKIGIFGPAEDESLQAAHTCHITSCVNPIHLCWQTNRENGLDSNSKPAINARKTHCLKCGEPLTRNHRQRFCRPCDIAQKRTDYESNREERIARQKRYYWAHREERLAYNREYAKKRREQRDG